jgi:hypothetical protein
MTGGTTGGQQGIGRPQSPRLLGCLQRAGGGLGRGCLGADGGGQGAGAVAADAQLGAEGVAGDGAAGDGAVAGVEVAGPGQQGDGEGRGRRGHPPARPEATSGPGLDRADPGILVRW